jgi:hypothetical protein
MVGVMFQKLLITVFAGLLCAASAIPCSAKNLDLSTVPRRDTVQLTIYNSEDLTLVRETRTVSFKRGENPLQFSWANTLIDPTSVDLRFLTDPDKLEVLDTTFPHDKPQMLYWNVQSEIDGEATVEITYFTSGISWSADYVLIAGAEEKSVAFEGFVRVQNQSGEQYEDAEVRLVVGRINLVEKIAQLARVPISEVSDLSESVSRDYRNAAMRNSFDLPTDEAASEAEPTQPKEIIKEGLSEYFIYTIEGTETIADGWSKRMRSLKPVDVPLRIQYRYREPEYGSQLVRMYLLKNDVASKLGTTPLPDGMVRVFRDNGRDGLSFVTAQSVKYIPIGDKIELNLGPDPEVIFELVKRNVWRDHIWMKIGGADVYRRVDAPDAEIEIRSSVAGWDDHTIYAQRVRNYTAKPIDIEVRRTLGGHIVFRSSLGAINHDFQTAQYTATVPPGSTAELLYEVVQHQGRNARQSNVTIEEAEIQP